MAEKPITTPVQKSPPNADFAGNPYSPHLRCSILAMISAARAVKTKMAPSLNRTLVGVSDEERASRTGPRCPSRYRTRKIEELTSAISATTIARKIRTRHPARIPFGPRKMEFGGAAGTGTAVDCGTRTPCSDEATGTGSEMDSG